MQTPVPLGRCQVLACTPVAQSPRPVGAPHTACREMWPADGFQAAAVPALPLGGWHAAEPSHAEPVRTHKNDT